ncbi:MAG: adenosine deaminase [Paludibacteraceae bacterium]|nr:adenosine deaminase [Paludibacteraceae bacterium]
MIDLHLHIDGSIPVRTARKLAEIQGIEVPESEAELKALMSLTPECKNLNDYLHRFAFALSLLQTPDALRICTEDLLAVLHEQGVDYAEIRFAPQLSTRKGMSQYDATGAVLEGIRNAAIPCGLILSMMRGMTNHAANKETLFVAKEYVGKGVVCVDLAGAEALYPTSDFADEFRIAQQLDLPLIVHAGEAAGASSVRAAVQAGARRIGHGVRSLEDPSVVRLLVERDVTLELCPTSNLQTGLFASYDEYPLRQLMNAGVKVCLNTDNMTISNTTLKDEWQHMIEAQHLTEEEIQQLEQNARAAAFN